jgi:hypothetical protein
MVQRAVRLRVPQYARQRHCDLHITRCVISTRLEFAKCVAGDRVAQPAIHTELSDVVRLLNSLLVNQAISS